MSRVHCDRCEPGAFRSSGQEAWCDVCLRGVLAGENPHSYIAPMQLDWYEIESSEIDTTRVRSFGYASKKRPANASTFPASDRSSLKEPDMPSVAHSPQEMQQTTKRGAA